jgi:hypothetical protein
MLSEREKVTRMKSNSFYRIAALFVALAMTVPAFAKPFTQTINLTQAAKVGKASLQAGEYRLLIDGNKATVQKGRNTVAETEGRWEERDQKSQYTSILLGADGQVHEVRFAGQKRVFVLGE